MEHFKKKLEAGRSPPSKLCPLGHDQAAYYEHTGGACPCVESKLPKESGGRRPVHGMSFDDTAPSPEELMLAKFDVDQMERASYGDRDLDELLPDDEKVRSLVVAAKLPARMCKLVELRVVHRLTFKEIALELGYASRHAAQASYRKALEKLRGKLK